MLSWERLMPALIAAATFGSFNGDLVTFSSSVTVLPGAKYVWLVALFTFTKILFTFAMSLPAHCNWPLLSAVAASVFDA